MSFKANVIEVYDYAVEHKALQHLTSGMFLISLASVIVYLSMNH